MGKSCREARNPDVFPQLEHRDPNLMLPALEIIKADGGVGSMKNRQVGKDALCVIMLPFLSDDSVIQIDLD